MAEHGVPIKRVINAGGIPQQNATLNQVYVDVLNKPVLVPNATPTSIGSGIFAQLAAGIFLTVEEAQSAMCPAHRVYQPIAAHVAVYDKLFALYRRVYFAFGDEHSGPENMGAILGALRAIASAVRSGTGMPAPDLH